MKYSRTLSFALLGAAEAFVPAYSFARGMSHQASTKRLASTWHRTQYRRQAIPSYHSSGRSLLNMNFLSEIFYDVRSNALGFASKEEVKAAARDPAAVFLDVRSPAEIAAAALDTSKPVIYATCTSTKECPALKELPSDKNVPVLVFCASGKRASNAKQVLESKGFVNVLNAGGLGDLDYLQSM